MPATDDYLRSPKMMHQVFCASSLLLLFTTVWMMWADYNDEWRTYQRKAFSHQAARLKARENQIKAAPEHKAKVDDPVRLIDEPNLGTEEQRDEGTGEHVHGLGGAPM